MQSVQGLIDRLELAAKNSDAPFDRRFADTTLWFFRNLERIPEANLQARMRLMEDTLWIMFELIAMQREDLMKLGNGRKPHTSLYLPSGIQLGGPLLSEQRK